MLLDGYKKILTTFFGMLSICFISLLVSKETIDPTHKIELYLVAMATIGALAGAHSYIQGQIDKVKSLNKPVNP